MQDCWKGRLQDGNDCIRDAARVLMAAATDPSHHPAGHHPPHLASFEALCSATRGEVPPDLLAQHSAELLCCAAACLYHDKLVPERWVSESGWADPALLALPIRVLIRDYPSFLPSFLPRCLSGAACKLGLYNQVVHKSLTAQSLHVLPRAGWCPPRCPAWWGWSCARRPR